MRGNAHVGAASCLRVCTSPTSFLSLLLAHPLIPAQRKLLPATTTTFDAVRYSSSSPSRKNGPPIRGLNVPKPNPAAANPPASTRPPPLELPVREPTASTFHHLFATGKAYLTFYKTGLRQIVENHKLRSSPSRPQPGTRAELLLRVRHSHDIRRLPLFGLMLLICGEFTPFMVLAIPSVVPFTCRIPRQVDKLLRDSEGRRNRALEDFSRKFPPGKEVTLDAVAGHLARVLDIVPPFLERIGITLPAPVIAGRVTRRLEFLAEDDTLLTKAGGVDALQGEELRLACADRAIRVRGRKDEELRAALAKWLSLAGREAGEGLHGQMVPLLLAGEERWP